MNPTHMDFPIDDPRELARALREFVLDASEEDLREALRSNGENFDSIASEARRIVAGALARSTSSERSPEVPQEIFDLRRSLSALLQLLRRRERLTEEDLAARAQVDVGELRRIEFDPSFAPTPRTIFQLEQFFNLPRRSLVLLSGHLRSLGPSVHGEAVRFAAHASSLGQLNRDEARLLADFVAFLKSSATDA